MKNVILKAILSSKSYSNYKGIRFVDKLNKVENPQKRYLLMYGELIRDVAELTKLQHLGAVRDKTTEMTTKLYEFIYEYVLLPCEDIQKPENFVEYNISENYILYLMKDFTLDCQSFIKMYYKCKSVTNNV